MQPADWPSLIDVPFLSGVSCQVGSGARNFDDTISEVYIPVCSRETERAPALCGIQRPIRAGPAFLAVDSRYGSLGRGVDSRPVPPEFRFFVIRGAQFVTDSGRFGQVMVSYGGGAVFQVVFRLAAMRRAAVKR